MRRGAMSSTTLHRFDTAVRRSLETMMLTQRCSKYRAYVNVRCSQVRFPHISTSQDWDCEDPRAIQTREYLREVDMPTHGK